jgi:hypothetical protein
VTYNPSKGKIYALLKDQAKSDDILKAAFHVRYMTSLFVLVAPIIIIFSYIFNV